MAPELLMGGKCTMGSDVYAISMTLVEVTFLSISSCRLRARTLPTVVYRRDPFLIVLLDFPLGLHRHDR
jgi:hypothetical protein